MAQLVAHLHGMQGVRGSNPLRSTKKAPKSTDLGAFGFLINSLEVLEVLQFLLFEQQ